MRESKREAAVGISAASGEEGAWCGFGAKKIFDWIQNSDLSRIQVSYFSSNRTDIPSTMIHTKKT